MIIKMLKSFTYASKGIYVVFLHENNARFHLAATCIAIILGAFFGISKNEWLWVTAAICSVWTIETINTAIEKLTDMVSPQYDKQAGMVKDLSAGAVLITAIFAATTGLIIFLPRIIQVLDI